MAHTPASACTFIKAKILSSLPKETESISALKKCLNFLETYKKAVELKVLNNFLKEFQSEKDENSFNTFSGFSTIPVYIFNPFNLISKSFDKIFESTVVLDCAEIESKTDFFTEIFKGILSMMEKPADGDDNVKIPIPYDIAAFLNHFKPSKDDDILIIFNNSSQINLSHLDDFVRLWERHKSELPKLKFVFDDSVCFLGMEARLRDRFRVKEVKVPRVKEVFDDFIIETINNELPFLLHPQLMKRFVDLTETISFNSLLNQIKFLLISHFNVEKTFTDTVVGLKDIFMFITDLAIKLKKIRPSTPLLSPSKDFYSVILGGILVDSQAYAEIINELKSLAPNDFVSLFPSKSSEKTSSKIDEFVNKMISEMKEKVSTSTSSTIKDFQLDLITNLTSFIRSFKVSIPVDYVIKDEKGNLRKAFEADPLTALQVALKFPSVYLNCKNCCSNGEISILSSSNFNRILSPLFHNKPTMLDVCLLYRISLEFPSKSINIMSWYKSFSSIVSKRQTDKSLITARFFKSLNELQLIGMVSEFGRSRRKRRFVDKYNITDSITFE